MRYPAAIWYPGPVEKQGYPGAAVNEARGVICHSMVGTFEGAKTRLEDVSKDPDGSYTANAAASWHFSVLQDGRVLQHYETRAVAWHAGSREWNARLIGIEHEGGPADEDYPLGSPQNNPSEPLTPAQLDASVTLVQWLAQTHGFALLRDGPDKGLYEHHEVYATSCPSGRIPWAKYMEDEVTDDDLRKISDVVKLNLAVAPLNDTQKQEAGDIVKIQLELFRQELEKAGQLPPRVP